MNRQGISVIATDDGPGIPDIRQALRDGFSTSGSLGLGLPGVRRSIDEFEINFQPGPGNTCGGKEMETIRDRMVEYGVAKFVLPGQGESGDHHLVCSNRHGILVAAIDGIGHGEEDRNLLADHRLRQPRHRSGLYPRGIEETTRLSR